MSVNSRLEQERETNRELEATCLELRNEVLHIQGEVKRAKMEGAADMQARVVEWICKQADRHGKAAEDMPARAEKYRTEESAIGVTAMGIVDGLHLDGPSPLDEIRREERAKGRDEERDAVITCIQNARDEVYPQSAFYEGYSTALDDLNSAIESAAHLSQGGDAPTKEDG